MHDTQFLDECKLTMTQAFLTRQNNNWTMASEGGWMKSKSERDVFWFSPQVCRFLSAIFPPARWRAEDQNLGLIYTSPGRCCQPASDWSLQISWPGPWPLIGCQLTSDCCIIPGSLAPPPVSLVRHGGVILLSIVRGVLRPANITGVDIDINIRTMPGHIHSQ